MLVSLGSGTGHIQIVGNPVQPRDTVQHGTVSLRLFFCHDFLFKQAAVKASQRNRIFFGTLPIGLIIEFRRILPRMVGQILTDFIRRITVETLIVQYAFNHVILRIRFGKHSCTGQQQGCSQGGFFHLELHLINVGKAAL